MEHQKKQQELLYLNAQRRVKEMKSFYIHLLVYLFVNTLHFFKIWNKEGDQFQMKDGFNFYIGVLWGIVIIIHAIATFYRPIQKWEDKKIKEFYTQNSKN